MKNIFVRSLAVLLVCLFAISGFNFSVFASNDAGLGDTLTAANIEIRGKIILMLYFKNLGDVEYFEVKIPQLDESVAKIKISKSQLTYDKVKDRYLLVIPLAAAQQSDEISFQAFDGNGNAGKLRTYSITKYAEQLFALAKNNPDNERYAEAAQAVRAMLNYGAMAQTYFGYNQTNMANEGLYYRGTNPIDGMTLDDVYGITSNVSPSYEGNGIRFTSVNAYLEENLSLRFYFEYTGTTLNSPEELTVTIEGEDYTNKDEIFRDEFGRYYVLVNSIPSTCFNTQYAVKLSDGTSSAEVEYSVFDYLLTRLKLGDDKKFADVAYSMFQFYAWTSEYVGTPIVPATCSHDRTYIEASKTIICSDCGEKQNEQAGVATNVAQDGSTITADAFTYTISDGGDFGWSDEFGVTDIDNGEKLTVTGITHIGENNYFTLHYYASAPVKITLNYANSNTEYYYLEAGENDFSAYEDGFFVSTSSTNSSAVNSITVEPLTDSADFVLFKYTATTVDINSLNLVVATDTDGGDKGCYIKYIGDEENGDRYRLGINLTWGGAISRLYDLTAGTSTTDSTNGQITNTTNLVNNCDAGRLIQQSYYGTVGSGDDYEARYWSSNPGTNPYAKWRYNPVQGGDANNRQSRIIDFEIGDNYVYIKAQPRDWANHELNDPNAELTLEYLTNTENFTKLDSRYTECYMENRYTLKGDYIQVDNRMVDFSGYDHPCTTQELPAFYTLAYFDDYYWYNGTQPWTLPDDDATSNLTRQDALPFWGNSAKAAETTFNYQVGNTETWAAFVNEGTKYGLGMYVPNTDVFKGGIFDSSNKDASSTSSNTSYFAPMKELQIVCYEPIEYSYLLCAGDLASIRQVFFDNKDFARNASLDSNSISQKIPAVDDMSSIDFSEKENLVFLDSVNDATLSYDADKGAAKFVVTGNDSYFLIDYTSLQDFNATKYPAASYTCIEFEYMIPADAAKYPGGLAAGQVLFYQVDNNTSPSQSYMVDGFVTLIADGKWHTATYYTSNIGANWTGNINSLRIDFLNNGSTGQTFYLKSFSITNDTAGSAITTLGGVGFSGQDLIGQLGDANCDKVGAATFNTYDGDYVTAVVGSVEDRFVGFVLQTTDGNGTTSENITGKYMVIKYRTDAIPTSASFAVFATVAGGKTISQHVQAGTIEKCQGNAYGLIGDGKWHTLVIDLSQVSADVAGVAGEVMLNEVRIDLFDSFVASDVIDIAFVGFCEDIDTAKETLGTGEFLELSTQKWVLSVDKVEMDGVAATKNGANWDVGAAQHVVPSLQGSVWEYAGWLAIDGSDVTTVEYCVTEEDGTENWFSVKENGSGVCQYREAGDDVKKYVVDEANYSEDTVPYRLSLQVDLRNYIGQTVTISVRTLPDNNADGNADGNAITLYYVKVKVVLPEYSSLDYVLAADDLYREMFGGPHDSIGTLTTDPADAAEVVKKADGTVSVTVTEKTVVEGDVEQIRKWIGIQPDSITATGGYMVIRYRTEETPTNKEFYLYVASAGKYVETQDNMMSSFGFVGDGNWHTLVIDLSVAKAVNVSLDYKYHISDVRLQMLDQLATGSVIDFAYIGFCNSLKDIPVYDNEIPDYGWGKWSANVDSAFMDGDISDTTYDDGNKAAYNSTNFYIGPDQKDIVLDGTTWALNGWFGFDGQSVEKLSISIANASGVKEYEEAIEPTTAAVPSRWYATDEITNHLTTDDKGPKYSYGTVGYRFNLSQDLSAFAGQTVTLSIKVITSEGLEVIIYRVKINVPAWTLYMNTFYHCCNPDYSSDLKIIDEPAVITNASESIAIYSDKEITANYIAVASAWVAVNGYSLNESLSYTIAPSDGSEGATGSVAIATDANQHNAVISATGYDSSTTGTYWITYAGTEDIINLTEYAGKTVTLTFSVTNANNTMTIDVMSITVSVPEKTAN